MSIINDFLPVLGPLKCETSYQLRKSFLQCPQHVHENQSGAITTNDV